MPVPRISVIGLPHDSPHVPDEAREMVKNGLAVSEKDMREAGYIFELWLGNPKDEAFLDLLKQKLTKAIEEGRPWDGCIIGFGVRGFVPMTEFFEEIIWTVQEASPTTRFGFNTSPSGCVEVAKRRWPIQKE